MNADLCHRCGKEPPQGQRLWPKTERVDGHYRAVRICSGCLVRPRAGEPAERRVVSNQTRGARLIGAQNPGAKLDERKVRELLRLHRRGVPARALAERFGLGQSTVRAICAGKKWRHVYESAL